MSKKEKPIYTTHEEDKKLVIQAMSGDQRSYNILARKYKLILFTAAQRRLPTKKEEDLEDIVMSVLGRCFISLHLYNPDKSKFFTWMVACLHNHVNAIPKGKKRISAESYQGVSTVSMEIREIGQSENIIEDIDRTQVIKLVRLLVEKLPPDVATAIKLKYFKDYTYEEIAEEIGCKVGDVWYKIKKGKKILKSLSDINGLFD
jgi:RNA polymerase sigma-70 factor (ECF subfamily)